MNYVIRQIYRYPVQIEQNEFVILKTNLFKRFYPASYTNKDYENNFEAK